MKVVNYLLLLLLFAVATTSYAQPTAPSGKKWQKIENLSDEFNGTSLNTAKWSADPNGHPHLTWQGRPPALFQESSFTVRNGKVEILVGKLASPKVINGQTFLYHGGILRSMATSPVGTYYECRSKMSCTEMGGGFWLRYNSLCKRHEIDITESVGVITPQTHSWAREWEQIFHTNVINHPDACTPEIEKIPGASYPSQKNSSGFFTYGCWRKSPTETLFYFNGKYAFTTKSVAEFTQGMYIQFSIEAYDWNPIPTSGSQVATASVTDRTAYIDYIRTYKLVDDPSTETGDKFALKNVGNSGYLSLSSGLISSNSLTLGTNQKFEMVWISKGVWALKGSNGRYVSSENGAKQMTCNRSSIGSYEKFTFESFGNDTWALRGNNNKYVRANGWCTGTGMSDYLKFTLVRNLKAGTLHLDEKQQENGSGLKVYPNPASSYLNVELENQDEAVTVSLFDVSGCKVKSEVHKSNKIRLNTSELSGLYIVKVSTPSGTHSKRVVIK